MRHLVLFCVMVCVSLSLLAQQNNFIKPENYSNKPDWAHLMYSGADIGYVKEAYDAYYKTHDFVKNGDTQYFKRLMMINQRDNNGSMFGLPLDDTKFSQTQFLERTERLESRGPNGLWTCIGPFDFDKGAASASYAAGAAHVYTVEQSVSNPDILYAGTANAGVWRSDDKGLNWVNLTHDMILGTVVALEIDYTNPDVIYFGGANQVYKSTSGGQVWNMTGDASFQSLNISVNDMIMSPVNNQELWIASDKGLYQTIDGGTNWIQLSSGTWQEIEIKPGDPTVMYAIKQPGVKTEFYKSTDSGNTFTIRLGGYPDAQSPDEQKRTEIAVTPAAPDIVYAYATGVADSGSGLYGIYVSHDEGENWTFQCCGTGPGGPPDPASNKNICAWAKDGSDDGGQYYYDLSLAVSPFDSNEVHACAVNHWVSTDGGSNFVCPSNWSESGNANYVHADIHDAHFNGNDWWIACDGGIFYSNDHGATWNRKMFGIEGTDFWGFGIGEGDDGDEVMIGGTYHNGTLLKDFNTYQNGWLSTMGGDNTLGKVNYAHPREIFSDYGKHRLSGDRTVGLAQLTATMLPSTSFWTGENSDMKFDPHQFNTVYITRDTSIWVSHDDGANYDLVHSWGQGKITTLEVAYNDPKMMYACYYDSWFGNKKLYKTSDGGQNWTDITPSGPTMGYTNLWAPFDIAVNLEHPDEVWLARTMQSDTYANLDGYKVFHSTDGGTTWTNYTTPTLNGEYATCIEYQRGTNGGVYLGTRRGVYYRNDTMSDWALYNNGLPASTSSTEIYVDYAKQRIIDGTNRSVWVAPVYEHSATKAQVSVSSQTVPCTRDTLFFRDHSCVSDSNVSYQWTFQGGTPSTSTIRNPKVTYAQPGTYDVSLTVSDAFGMDTQTLPGFITVNNACSAADSVPDNALMLDGITGAAIIPPLNLNSNHVTIMAWIKPMGIQNDWAGIVFTRSANSLCGMSLAPGNELRFHWNAANWTFGSGLYVDTSQWSHVALVITPDSATLYVNGQHASDHLALAPEKYDGETAVGMDNCCGNRHFKGYIDEVSIYDRSLTTNEIRTNMHLTKVPANDPSLVAYYQFNEQAGAVIDHVGSRNGSIGNGAARAVSTGPFGGGVSVRLPVNIQGSYTFGNTGFKIVYPAGSTVPMGDLVATRINLNPDFLPDSTYWNARSYWIVDNYGTNQTFTEPDLLQFQKVGNVNSWDEQHPSDFKLYERGHNADLNTWLNPIDSAYSCVAGADGQVVFSSTVPVTSFGQFDLVNSAAFPTGSPVHQNADNSFELYPNPADSHQMVVVKSSLDESVTITLFNEQGQKLRQQSFSKQTEINIGSLPAGAYTYRIKSRTHIQNGTLIIQ